jgi:hypothetical protein
MLREEHKLSMIKKRELGTVYGSKREEVTGWRKLHKEEFHVSTLHQILSQ